MTTPNTSAGAWTGAFKAYLDDAGARHSRQMDVPAARRKVAVACLDLAARSLQAGASVPAGFAQPVAAERAAAPRGRAGVFVVVAACVGALNAWLLDTAGIVSVVALLAVFANSYWEEIAATLRRRPAIAPADRPAPVTPLKPVIEDVLRRADDIAALAGMQGESPPPRGLKDSTLEFFQDILEAKAGGDRDFAFKKISRTVGSVLAAEGIGVCTYADTQSAMFLLDTVVDPLRADQVQTVRPALTRDSECLLPGYAKRFVTA